jgi:hypothetical protein
MITKQANELIKSYLRCEYTLNRMEDLEKIRILIKAYKEQMSVMHQIYLDLINYNCGKHKKLGSKIQIQIDALRDSIKAMKDSQTSGSTKEDSR